jgi:signal transduction histidine kinase
MPIPPVQAAMESDLGSMLYRGFLGDEVVGAYAAMPEYGWIVIAEMGTEEALAGLRMIMVNTLGAAAIALILMLLGFLLTRRWTRPLENVAAASQKITSGDYSVRVPETRRRDEVGTLVSLFNRMVQSLQKSREELKESHQRLIQSEKLAAIGQFAASIVHEMRSPLSSIKMNTRLLSREAETDSVETKHLSLAEREITRMEMMFTELLDYGKPITLAKMQINIADLAKSSFDVVKEKSELKRVVLELDLEEAPAVIIADQEQLLRALVNLLNNSIEACSEEDMVILKVRGVEGDKIQFIVQDNGKGMSERVVSRIFDPFFTTRDDGIGLGMNNVKKVIDAHLGSIEVESEEGKGTTVSIMLPIEENHGDLTGH